VTVDPKCARLRAMSESSRFLRLEKNDHVASRGSGGLKAIHASPRRAGSTCPPEAS